MKFLNFSLGFPHEDSIISVLTDILPLLSLVAAACGVGFLLHLYLLATRPVNFALHSTEEGSPGTGAKSRYTLRHVSFHR